MVDEISVIMPVYNEAENIERVLQQTYSALARLFHRYEVVIINDGSNDGTDAIVQKLAHEYKNLRVISFESNRGYGAALREGFSNSLLKYIFYTDADGQFDVKEIEGMLPLMDRCDMVAGFRINRKDSIIRKMSSMAYNMFARLFLGISFRDINCSFKLFKRRVFDSIALESKGFSIDAELLWKADRAGFRIIEHGVRHYKRDKGISKVRLADTVATIRELFHIKKVELKRAGL